jgi:hypothetical protein
LDELRGEVRALNRTFSNLRQDDLRVVMGEQIRPVLAERIDRYFAERGAHGAAERRTQELCRNDLIDFLNEAIRVFQREGKEDLARYLDER